MRFSPNSLKKKGEKDIYLIHSEKVTGEDGEATVDGIHFTDLGDDEICQFDNSIHKKNDKAIGSMNLSFSSGYI